LEIVIQTKTYLHILRDLLFLLKRRGEHPSYSRLAILLSALFLESLSNLLFDNVCPEQELKDIDKRTDLPKPLRRFRAVYLKVTGEELRLDTSGIRDIFTIRNKVIAHPAGESIECRTQDSSGNWQRTRVVPNHKKELKYHKLQRAGISTVYEHFSTDHAVCVFEETKEFLQQFSSLLRQANQNLADACWPKELSSWIREGDHIADKTILDKLSIYIPQKKIEEKPVERLIKLGEKKDRSINYMVVEAILEYLNREEKKV